MRPAQFRRIYNVIFGVLAVGAFLLGLQPAQVCLDSIVLEPMRSDARRKGKDLEIREYNRILAAEGIAKAQKYSRMPKVTVLYPDFLEFLENNKRIVSMASLALVLVFLYFAIWYGIRGAVRYVANAPET